MPEEDKRDPPRAAPGSNHLPWDKFNIPTKAVFPPVGRGCAGEVASVKAAVRDSRRGGTTNATAKIRTARGNCAAGRQPSVSRSAAPALKGAGGTPRRNESGANGRRTRARRRRRTVPRRTSRRGPRVVTQQELIRQFFVIDPAVTSRHENPDVHRPATAATPAARP